MRRLTSDGKMATQPCPCGNAGEPTRECRCGAGEIERYRARLSGPLADRIDIHLHVGAVPVRALSTRRAGESSATIRERVAAARSAQSARYAGATRVFCNAQAPVGWLNTRSSLEPAARNLLAAAAERMGLTARGYHRVLRVARTVADLDGASTIAVSHVAEALRYRPPSRDSHLAGRVTCASSGAGSPQPDRAE